MGFMQGLTAGSIKDWWPVAPVHLRSNGTIAAMPRWGSLRSRHQRCALCRTRFPIADLTEELICHMPAAGGYRLVWQSARVCAACRKSNRDWMPRANLELRGRLREPCRLWLSRAPRIDPSDWRVKPETVAPETAVEQCLDAFFTVPERQFEFASSEDRLPETHEGILRKRDPDPFYEQSFSSYEGSVGRTPEGQIFFNWHFTHSVEPD